MAFNFLRRSLFKFTLLTLLLILLANVNFLLKNKQTNQQNLNILSTVYQYKAPMYFKNQAPLQFEGFSYDYWKENQLIPRVLEIKDHKDFMNLIEIVVKIFALNDVEFMLGKYVFIFK